MNLVAFSIKTKGLRNFARRLWTVFARFGFSDRRTRADLLAIVRAVQRAGSAPTFFIPAVVLARHPDLIADIARGGAEFGIHGYVHNDYRALSQTRQYEQTKQAAAIFQRSHIAYAGFRNPYLGWTNDSVVVFAKLGMLYDSNEAVHYPVIDLTRLPRGLRSGYTKSLELFQAIACTDYTLRPHFEGTLLRLPTSIPDDEMLYDRLRITNVRCIGAIWRQMLERTYELGGLYVLNLHPERGLLCLPALECLLASARQQPLRVWLAQLAEVAQWWRDRCQFALRLLPLGPRQWQVEASCSAHATILVRHLVVEDQPAIPWYGPDAVVRAQSFTVSAARCPCLGLTPETPDEVVAFLREQGYPACRAPRVEANDYALYLDLSDGLGATRDERISRRGALVRQIETLEAPLVRFGCWPDQARAALAITGDIDSVTVQDFFLRVIETGDMGDRLGTPR
ncbi:MAG TPA: polysaccharide deacetylase family protein [Ktedonobacterales bacterium]|jgi:peptidoglycan/xylan/chitin deacetylase (PgdA/CDA1 family)|nr:polysaccharide deacetylase family protein [Ktedonobacterales bacterium]